MPQGLFDRDVERRLRLLEAAAETATVAALDARYVPRNAVVILTDATQSIAASTTTDITWGTEISDPDGWTSGGSATLTVPAGRDGLYHVCMTISWALAAGAAQGIICQVNGVNLYAVIDAATWNIQTLSFIRTLTAGETLKFRVIQTSAGAVNVDSRLEIAPG
jgi:hypothetical protein